MATHGITRQGAGGTTAGSTTLIDSNIELPAGGPWLIHGLWMQVVQSAAVAAETLAGNIVLDSRSGDLTPDPAPGTFPMPGLIATAGANQGLSVCPLKIIPIQFQAAGKAVVSLSYYNQLALSAAPQVACGIIFGDAIPTQRPVIFCDGVRGTQTAAAETSVGTITLSTRATRITGIFADICVDGTWTADEEFLGVIRLGSSDVPLPPSNFPLMRAFSPGDGTPVGHSDVPYWDFIPVDIPVEGGARIDTYIDLNTAVTNAVTVAIYLAYE